MKYDEQRALKEAAKKSAKEDAKAEKEAAKAAKKAEKEAAKKAKKVVASHPSRGGIYLNNNAADDFLLGINYYRWQWEHEVAAAHAHRAARAHFILLILVDELGPVHLDRRRRHACRVGRAGERPGAPVAGLARRPPFTSCPHRPIASFLISKLKPRPDMVQRVLAESILRSSCSRVLPSRTMVVPSPLHAWHATYSRTYLRNSCSVFLGVT